MIAKLQKTIDEIRSGKVVGVAWVAREADCFQPHWWSTEAPANYNRAGHFQGNNLLRAGVCYLAAFMDADALGLVYGERDQAD